MQITTGPFAGVCPGEDEIRVLTDRNGQPVIRDGVVLKTWGVHQRTPHFLNVFPPANGWGVEIVHEPGAFDLPDPDSWVPDGEGGTRMVTNPTMLFTARLVSPDGRTVGCASYLKLINSITSHQEGETLARGKLYDAMGLLGSTNVGITEVGAGSSADSPVASGAPSAVVAIATTGNALTKLIPAAQALIDENSGKATVAVETETAAGQSAVDSATQPEAPAAEPEEEPAVAKPAIVAAKPAAVPTAAPAATAAPSSTPETHAINGDLLNANLLRQAANRARLQGVALPTFTDADHLRTFYRDLCSKRQAS